MLERIQEPTRKDVGAAIAISNKRGIGKTGVEKIWLESLIVQFFVRVPDVGTTDGRGHGCWRIQWRVEGGSGIGAGVATGPRQERAYRHCWSQRLAAWHKKFSNFWGTVSVLSTVSCGLVDYDDDHDHDVEAIPSANHNSLSRSRVGFVAQPEDRATCSKVFHTAPDHERKRRARG